MTTLKWSVTLPRSEAWPLPARSSVSWGAGAVGAKSLFTRPWNGWVEADAGAASAASVRAVAPPSTSRRKGEEGMGWDSWSRGGERRPPPERTRPERAYSPPGTSLPQNLAGERRRALVHPGWRAVAPAARSPRVGGRGGAERARPHRPDQRGAELLHRRLRRAGAGAGPRRRPAGARPPAAPRARRRPRPGSPPPAAPGPPGPPRSPPPPPRGG